MSLWCGVRFILFIVRFCEVHFLEDPLNKKQTSVLRPCFQVYFLDLVFTNYSQYYILCLKDSAFDTENWRNRRYLRIPYKIRENLRQYLVWQKILFKFSHGNL